MVWTNVLSSSGVSVGRVVVFVSARPNWCACDSSCTDLQCALCAFGSTDLCLTLTSLCPIVSVPSILPTKSFWMHCLQAWNFVFASIVFNHFSCFSGSGAASHLSLMHMSGSCVWTESKNELWGYLISCLLSPGANAPS